MSVRISSEAQAILFTSLSSRMSIRSNSTSRLASGHRHAPWPALHISFAFEFLSESFKFFVLPAELILVFEMADSPLLVHETESEADDSSERI
jgi:hypothetical protein